MPKAAAQKKNTASTPVTSPTQWKKKSSKQSVPLDVPSGNTALVRAPGAEEFIQMGMVPNSLLGIIQTAAQKGEAPAERELQDIMEDPEKLKDMFKFVDAVTIYCCVDPVVHPTPGADDEYDKDLLYVNEVDLEDKMFILQYAMGGTRDLETFRKQQDERVDLISSREDVGSAAQ
jgi:hypothetical protein